MGSNSLTPILLIWRRGETQPGGSTSPRCRGCVEEVRLAIYSVRSQLPPNTRSIKAVFSLEGCSRVEPSSCKRLSLRCSQSSWAGEGELGEGRGLLGGALSVRNDRCISSAPGLSLSTLGRAEALLVPMEGKSLLAPLLPALSVQGLRRCRDREWAMETDTETHGERQRYVDTEAGETKNQAGRLRKTTDRD